VVRVLVGNVGEYLVAFGAGKQEAQQGRGEARELPPVIIDWLMHQGLGCAYFYIVENAGARARRKLMAIRPRDPGKG
jgi:hypothetical protein